MGDKRKAKRLTIGLMLSWMEDSYHIPIWKSISARAAEQDINLMMFVGGSPDNTGNPENARTCIYDLANEDVLSGLIIVANSISNFITSAQLEQFCSRYRSLPLVTIGNALEGIPAVMIDNRQGMYEVVKHLVEVHDYRRFAFFSGPVHSEEGALRIRGFREALEECRIPFNEALLIKGDFSYRFSEGADTILAVYKQNPFDVLVCANDYMAMNTILRFTDAGYKIPKDLGITGFDDIPAAKHIDPPLTTIKQPLDELGEKAFELLIGSIRRQELPAKTFLPTNMIIRQSCGCLSYSVNQVGTRNRNITIKKHAPPLASRTAAITGLVNKLNVPPIRKESVSGWLNEFISAIEEYLKNRKKINEVIYTFSDILLALPDEKNIENYWHHLLAILREGLLDLFSLTAERKKIQLIFNKLSIHLTELLLRTNTYKTLRFWEENYELNIINYNITSSFDFPTLIKHIVMELPRLHIANCYIAEFEEKIYTRDYIHYQLPLWSRLLLACKDNKIIGPGENEARILTHRLIPPHLLPQERSTLILMPLFNNNITLGYILLQLSDCNPATYLAIESTISSALIGARNVEELKKTKAIAESVSRIKSQFIANISHEIRTPLNLILGFTDLLLEEERNKDKQESLETINKAGKNLLAIINDVLDFSKIEAGKIEFHYEMFNLHQFIGHIKNMFSLKAAKQNLEFKIDMKTELPVQVIGDEQRLTQIMINLLGNAFKFTEKGMVHVICSHKNDIITIVISDTGIGIEMEKLNLLFSPFQQVDSSTTRKYGGTGLGLAISHNLAEKMGGDIGVQSIPGKGSTFTIKLPLRVYNPKEEEERIPATVSVSESFTLPETSMDIADPKIKIAVKLDSIQMESLKNVINKLRKCRKVLDEEMVKQAADGLLLVSPDTAFDNIREQLYLAAENYESVRINNLTQELEDYYQSHNPHTLD